VTLPPPHGFAYSSRTVHLNVSMTWAALRKWFTLLGSGTAVSLTALPVHADGAVPEEAEIVARERPSTRSFYGWQILATGEAGGVLAAMSTILPDSPMKSIPSAVGFLVGMPFYALGGPATHWTHGNFQKGLISFGANVVGVLAGGLIGQGVACGQSDSQTCGADGFFAGFSIALVTVPLGDALILGWEDIPDDDPLPTTVTPGRKGSAERPFSDAQTLGRQPAPAQFSMIPGWSLGPRGELAFGVSGRF
jgi:hypothetical protein